MPELSWTERAVTATRLDRSPAHRPASLARSALAVLASLAGSLAADALLVEVGRRLFPSTNGYVHFRFTDYGALTLIGVLAAGAAWPVTVRISSSPRWLFLRLAVVVTLGLWLPDLWILAHGQPPPAVAVLMVMHLAVALVTYNLLVRLAPVRPPGSTPSGSTSAPRRVTHDLVVARTRRAGAVMGSLVILELVLGIGTLVVVPFDRHTAWLPAHGHLLYVVHALLGGVLGLGAVALLIAARTPRITRLGAIVGFGGVLMGAAGGLASVDLSTRLLGVGLMLVGTVVAGFGYLMVAVEVPERAPPTKILRHRASTGSLAAVTNRLGAGDLPVAWTRSRVAERWSSYLALTKPRIIELLLITTVPTMFVAARHVPSVRLMVLTVAGGALAAGGANALNMVYDRDIDALMERTKNRPLVTGAITPRAATVFALALEVAAFTLLWLTVNRLSAVLAVAATAFYIGVYTMWLKRSSPQNIVIGGAAGAVPVLVGWSAVTGHLGLAPFVMFAIIFLWTPPHFWALAVRYRDDYAKAHVPMLPSIVEPRVVTHRILGYVVALWVASLVLAPAAHLNVGYAAAAFVLGAVFLASAWTLRRDPSPRRAMKLFGYSITYLTALFVAMGADAVIRVH